MHVFYFKKIFDCAKISLGGSAAIQIISRLFSTIKLCLHQYVFICCLHKCIKTSHLNFKPLLRKLPKTPGGLLFMPQNCRTIIGSHRPNSILPRCMECRRGLAMGILSVRPSVCLSVRLSVCLSVCQTRALWQNGRKLSPDFYTMR